MAEITRMRNYCLSKNSAKLIRMINGQFINGNKLALIRTFIGQFLKDNKKDCVVKICRQHSDINDSHFVNFSNCLLSTSNCKFCFRSTTIKKNLTCESNFLIDFRTTRSQLLCRELN